MASTNLSVTMVPALQISTTSLPTSSVGVSYSATLAATGGFPAYTWSITQGSLPSGLILNVTSGVISGTATSAGSSTFTVKLADNGTPPASTTASLSIAIATVPARSAALYVSQGAGSPPGPAWDQTGLQIQADGSLTLLPSSPESAINGSNFAASPTLPLVFVVSTVKGELGSLLVNPDYSLASYSSSNLPPAGNETYDLSMDPTGSNLYLTGPIDSTGTTGVTILPGNGSLQALGTLAIANVGVYPSRVVFTPDGKLAFFPTCYSSTQSGIIVTSGSILSYSRASDGTLTTAATCTLPNYCTLPMAVSPDGKYLAAADGSDVQIYTIASNGTLTPVLSQPLTVTLGQGVNEIAYVSDMVWDQSGTYLIVATTGSPTPYDGGVTALSFSGSALTQTVDPTGGGTNRILRTGSMIYAMRLCNNLGCIGPFGILGFDFQNGQLVPLPGSPYPYGNGLDMVVY
jgi:Putative Ig domain